MHNMYVLQCFTGKSKHWYSDVQYNKKKGGKSNLIYSTKSSLEDTKVEVKADRGASEQH